MFGNLFGGGKKKTPFKLNSRQEVEVEIEAEDHGSYEAYFVQVVDVQRKKIVLGMPGTASKPVVIHPSQKVTLSVLNDDCHLSCEATVSDVSDGEFQISWPPKDYDEVSLPARDDSFQVKVPIPVEFRAMRTAHTQVASTHAVAVNSLFLSTNLAIPPNTSLLMELEMPTGGITAKGRALTSKEDTSTGRKRFVTEIEYEDLDSEDSQKIIRYGLYYQQRQARADKRGG